MEKTEFVPCTLMHYIAKPVVLIDNKPACPHCANPVILEYDYCPHCGQALNWEVKVKE